MVVGTPRNYPILSKDILNSKKRVESLTKENALKILNETEIVKTARFIAFISR